MTQSIITKHLVIVGDGTVGKTCLAHSYTNDSFLESYVPTIYDREVFELTLDGVLHSIKLHDTAGQEEFERIRRIAYKEADCFILCYSINNRASFENIKLKWLPELRNIERRVPIVLVATKTDLRREQQGGLYTTEMGIELSREISANTFIECSSKENYNVKEVIYEAVRAAVNGPVEEEQEEEVSCWDSILACF